jgi:hypothetical protein
VFGAHNGGVPLVAALRLPEEERPRTKYSLPLQSGDSLRDETNFTINLPNMTRQAMSHLRKGERSWEAFQGSDTASQRGAPNQRGTTLPGHGTGATFLQPSLSRSVCNCPSYLAAPKACADAFRAKTITDEPKSMQKSNPR